MSRERRHNLTREPVSGPDDFAAAFEISRETRDRLVVYADLLATWQRTVNLVAPRSVTEIWHRHFADSAQLLELAPPGGHWVDFGSGAGFPGLVSAILRAGGAVDGGTRQTLVESDSRKCAFLAEVVRKTGIAAVFPVEILCARIEAASTRATLDSRQIRVLSARAVAPLRELLDLSGPLFGPETVGLFLKGRGAAAEVEAARAAWRFECRLHPSLTEPGSAVIEVREPKGIA